jgi:hypothetical protein
MAYKTPIVIPTIDVVNALRKEYGYGNVKVLEANEVTDKSKATGHPIFMPLQLDPVTYTDTDGGTVSLPGLYIPCAILEFTLAKNIVKTQVASARFRGTVKEHVSIGDWQVSIKGILIGNDALYPEKEVETLYQYFKCPVAVPVTHEICTILNIYYLVFEEPAFSNKQGFENLQPFSISAVSDDAPVINLNAE